MREENEISEIVCIAQKGDSVGLHSSITIIMNLKKRKIFKENHLDKFFVLAFDTFLIIILFFSIKVIARGST